MAVADDDPDGLRDAGARTGARSLYADYREMLERERLDFVAVCPRWLDARAEMVIAAAEAGVKGLFCEKPFARTLAEADAMLEACERAGTRVAVAHRRANPYEQRARAMVAEGAIGELQSLRGQGKCDHRSGAQDLMVLGTHMMDSMRYVAGSDVVWASGHVTQDGRDVTVEDIREGDEEMGLIAGNALFATYAFRERGDGVVRVAAGRRPAGREQQPVRVRGVRDTGHHIGAQLAVGEHVRLSSQQVGPRGQRRVEAGGHRGVGAGAAGARGVLYDAEQQDHRERADSGGGGGPGRGG